MRGRTNVINTIKTSDNAGIEINGEIKHFQVAENTTINSGDFVETVYSTSMNVFSDSSYTLNDIYQINNDTYVCRNKGTIVLFKYIDDFIHIIYTYDETLCNYLFKLENNLFLSCGNVTFTFSINFNTDSYFIDIIKNHNLNVGSFTLTRVSDGLLLLYSKYDGNFSSSATTKPYIKIRYLDISNHNNICFYCDTITYEFRKDYCFKIKFLGAYDNIVYLAVNQKSEDTSIGSTKYYYFYYTTIYKFTVNSDYTSVTMETIKIHGSGRSSSSNKGTEYTSISGGILNNINDKYLIYTVMEYSRGGLMSDPTFGSGEYYIYDVSETPKLIYELDNYETKIDRIEYISQNIWCIISSNLSELNYVIAYYNETEKILYIDSEVSINRLVNNTNDLKDDAALFVYNNNEIIFVPTRPSPAYSIPFTLSDTTLILGKDKNIVKLYSDKSKNPIGIAKESGRNGEIIEVYCP